MKCQRPRGAIVVRARGARRRDATLHFPTPPTRLASRLRHDVSAAAAVPATYKTNLLYLWLSFRTSFIIRSLNTNELNIFKSNPRAEVQLLGSDSIWLRNLIIYITIRNRCGKCRKRRCGSRREHEMRRRARGESESGASADAAPGSVAPAPHTHHKGLYVTQQ